MMLRSARRYDLESDTIIFANGVPFGRENIAMGGLKDYADGMFAFCASMAKLGVDNAEYALITAICIFSGTAVDVIDNIPLYQYTKCILLKLYDCHCNM